MPHRLRHDGWWLSENADPQGDAPSSQTHSKRPWATAPRQGLALLGLVILADLLFWGKPPGLSLVVFAVATFALAIWSSVSATQIIQPTILLVLGCLPVVEHVQLLSMSFLVASLVVAVVWARLPKDTASATVIRAALMFWGSLPQAWLRGLWFPVRLARASVTETTDINQSIWRTARDWAVPAGGALVFISLLVQANPIVETWVAQIFDSSALVQRALFWSGFVLVLSPFLNLSPQSADPSTGSQPWRPWFITRASTQRALWVFNGIIALQTSLDASILLGGAELPEGMTYAHYAHRGAYPLLITTLIAGTFALLARPFLEECRGMRPLMYLWLAQNILLCGSAFLRLDLYVDAYGLTYLRIYAQIWIILVALGLGLIGVQIFARTSNAWLTLRLCGLSIVTLYGACFVNFAQIIAEQNLKLPEPDLVYICQLGPLSGYRLPEGKTLPSAYLTEICTDPIARPDTWHEWGFRTWRMAAYAQTMPSEGLPQ